MSRARWYWRAGSFLFPRGVGRGARLASGGCVLAWFGAGGDAALIAEPFEDVEGALVLAGGFLVVPAVLGQDAELAVGRRHMGLIAEPFGDVEGALVLAGGFLVVPAV